MPTQIQNLVPVQRSVPTPAKPVDSRADDRKDDFRQFLDDASNKPAERAETPPKPAKADGKKPAEKASGAAAKTKAARKDKASDAAGEAEAAEDTVVDDATGQVAAGADESPEAEEAEPVSEAADQEEFDKHGAPKDKTADATAVDPATLLKAAASVAPTQGEPAADKQPNADGEIEGTETLAVPAASQKARTGKHVKAVAADAADASDDQNASGDADPAAADPAAVAGAAATAAGEDGSSADPDADPEQGGTAAAAAATKPAGTTPMVSALGAQRVPEVEAKSGKAVANNTATDPTAAAAAQSATDAVSQFAELVGPPAEVGKDSTKSPLDADATSGLTLDATGSAQAPGPQAATAPKVATPPPLPPEVKFADANHDSIVTGVKAQLLPHGGSMQIRLDPPELGALKVMVEMRDGAMTATFQTSNEEATRLLSHSLNQLKHVLEGQGVSVDRLQVQQAPKSDSQSSAGDDPRQQQQNQNWQDEHAARQEQQRKEMLRRMWRRVSGAGDPIDVTA